MSAKALLLDGQIFPIPEGATDYLFDGFSCYFYKRIRAFSTMLLELWDGNAWQIAGTLPWAQLETLNADCN